MQLGFFFAIESYWLIVMMFSSFALYLCQNLEAE